MLGADGRLKGDLSVLRWPDGRWWLMGSYGLRSFHRRWFQEHLGPDVVVQDLSDAVAGFSISGPRARDILQRTTDLDLSTLAMMQCMECDVGLLRARVARISLAGELAYEINVLATEHATLRRTLLEAGAGLGLREIGFNAMFTLRLEKSVGIWNLEYTQGRSAAMTGLDRARSRPSVAPAAAPPGDPAGRGDRRRLLRLRAPVARRPAGGHDNLWRLGTQARRQPGSGHGRQCPGACGNAAGSADRGRPSDGDSDSRFPLRPVRPQNAGLTRDADV
jgi:dimethylglycine dehydrogenase